MPSQPEETVIIREFNQADRLVISSTATPGESLIPEISCQAANDLWQLYIVNQLGYGQQGLLLGHLADLLYPHEDACVANKEENLDKLKASFWGPTE